MYDSISFSLTGDELLNCGKFNITLPLSNRLLIRGVVKNFKGIPLNNIGIEVIKFNNRLNTSISLGVTFTDICGQYAVSLKILEEDEIYRFTAYSAANI